MDLSFLMNIAVMVALIAIFYLMQTKFVAFSKRVLGALVAGIALGLFVHTTTKDPISLKTTLEWYDIIGSGYVGLLQMMIYPLVIVSILKAMMKIDPSQSLGKTTTLIIGVFIITTVVSALIGAFVSIGFKLNANDIIGLRGSSEIARSEYLSQTLATNQNKLTIPQTLLSFIPRNPFLDMAGVRSSSLIAIVIFTLFLGTALLDVRRKKPESVQAFLEFINSLQAIISRMLTKVIRLTPYGVIALMAHSIATSNLCRTIALGKFVAANYIALLIVLVFHTIILISVKINPITYFRKTSPLLLFAFTSRSSAASVPLNIEVQEKKLGVSSPIANLSSTFGAVMGQNGCGGVYPAMLAVMIAASNGTNPLSFSFLFSLLVIVAISSFGVAGVGGGATFAALMILPALGLDVTLVGLLIAIEPLIDMMRTIVNVNTATVNGIFTSKMLGSLNESLFNSTEKSSSEIIVEESKNNI